jgi:hypothetical protein
MRRALPELGVTELYWPLESTKSANICSARLKSCPFYPRGGLACVRLRELQVRRSSCTSFDRLNGEN